MALEIRRSERLTEEEDRSLLRWEPDIFEIDAYGLAWRDQDWHFVGYVNGEPVCHAGTITHTVTVGGRPVRVGGFGAVVTLPPARGKGYARRTLRTAIDFLRDDLKVAFCLLFCIDRMVPFYEKMGWKKVPDTVIVEQPQGKIPYPMNVMTLALGEEAWPEGVVELTSLPW